MAEKEAFSVDDYWWQQRSPSFPHERGVFFALPFAAVLLGLHKRRRRRRKDYGRRQDANRGLLWWWWSYPRFSKMKESSPEFWKILTLKLGEGCTPKSCSEVGKWWLAVVLLRGELFLLMLFLYFCQTMCFFRRIIDNWKLHASAVLSNGSSSSISASAFFISAKCGGN